MRMARPSRDTSARSGAHVLVEDVDVVHAKGKLEAAALVAHRDRAEEALVGAAEVDGDGFPHAERGVGPDIQRDGEAIDGERALLRPRRPGQRRQAQQGAHRRLRGEIRPLLQGKEDRDGGGREREAGASQPPTPGRQRRATSVAAAMSSGVTTSLRTKISAGIARRPGGR